MLFMAYFFNKRSLFFAGPFDTHHDHDVVEKSIKNKEKFTIMEESNRGIQIMLFSCMVIGALLVKKIRFFFVKCKKFMKSSKNIKSAKILSVILISMQNLSRDVYSYSYKSFIYLTSYSFVADI